MRGGSVPTSRCSPAKAEMNCMPCNTDHWDPPISRAAARVADLCGLTVRQSSMSGQIKGHEEHSWHLARRRPCRLKCQSFHHHWCATLVQCCATTVAVSQLWELLSGVYTGIWLGGVSICHSSLTAWFLPSAGSIRDCWVCPHVRYRL
jgi:hypothetical protein